MGPTNPLCETPSPECNVAIHDQAIDILQTREEKITRRELIQAVKQRMDVPQSRIRAAIRECVEGGDLAYTQCFGQTYIEISYDRPVHVSSRLVLVPERKAYRPTPGETVVRLRSGAAFGNGSHPTTRLAMRGIEALSSMRENQKREYVARGLDIGTGSGVLAITMQRLGIDFVQGFDLEMCAVDEARYNARLNEAGDKIDIQPGYFVSVPDVHMDMIAANLRAPTLMTVVKNLCPIMRENCAMVVSGMRNEEAAAIEREYRKHDLLCCWKEAEKGWMGMGFIKKPGPKGESPRQKGVRTKNPAGHAIRGLFP
jgi:ribosomal protein L11 methyltransferase